jgi:hypothetical protein
MTFQNDFLCVDQAVEISIFFFQFDENRKLEKYLELFTSLFDRWFQFESFCHILISDFLIFHFWIDDFFELKQNVDQENSREKFFFFLSNLMKIANWKNILSFPA